MIKGNVTIKSSQPLKDLTFCVTGKLKSYKNRAEINIVTGTNNKIALEIPSGYNGDVFIEFVQPGSWYIATAISVITSIFVLLIVLKNKLKK